MIHARLQIAVLRSRQGEGDVHALSLGGLQLIALGVKHLDIKGVGHGNIHILGALCLHRRVHHGLCLHRDLCNRKSRLRREYALGRGYADHNIVHRFAL